VGKGSGITRGDAPGAAGTRRRRAASASAQAAGGTGPGTRRAAPAHAGAALCGQCAGSALGVCGGEVSGACRPGTHRVARRLTDGDTVIRVVNGLREYRVLISATGPQGSILKICSLLSFTRGHQVRLE
jgi:hypothetical protein